MAEIIYTFVDPPREKDIERAVQCLENGGVIAYPTDVNWAFGCDVLSSSAIDKIRLLKPAHSKEKPFSLICSSISMISDIAIVNNNSYRLLKKLLPGPYTLLLKSNKRLPKQIHDKRKVVGVRHPESPLLLALVERLGRPLLSSSIPHKPSMDAFDPASAIHYGYEVDESFGHGIDLILDLGGEVEMKETSIIDLTEEFPVVIREGVGDISPFK